MQEVSDCGGIDTEPPMSDRIKPSSASKHARRWWRRKSFARGPKWLVALLHELEREQSARLSNSVQRSSTWLLRYRPQFRRLDEALPTPIHAYLRKCPETMAPVAIWLLGRCAIRTEHFALFDLAINAPPAARRHAARALRRVEAWEKLRKLAKRDPRDAKIAWYAYTPVTKRNFRERLHNFTDHVDASHADQAAGPSRMPLWFADLDWIRRPSKPLAYIREILERIHRWVQGAD
jgi:hypothetical protein